MQLVVPVAVQQIVDGEILGGEVDVGGVLLRGLGALIAIGLAVLAGRAALVRLAVASGRGLSDLRVSTFGHLHKLSILHVEAERRGSLVTSDVTTIQDFMDWGGVGWASSWARPRSCSPWS